MKESLVGPLERRREYTAAVLATGLLLVFAGTVLSPIVFWWRYGVTPPGEVLTYIKDVAAIETTLLAATVGFYFSQKRLF